MTNRSFFPGVILVLIGIALLAERAGVIDVGFWGFVWLLAAAGGLAMLARGLTGRGDRGGKVFWGVVFLVVGAYGFLDQAGVIYADPGYVVAGVFFTLGAAFVAASAVPPTSLPGGIVGFALLAVGSAIVLAEMEALARWEVRDAITTWWPVVLIMLGASILVPRRRA